MKQPYMIAKSVCGVSKLSRGRFFFLFLFYLSHPIPSVRLRRKYDDGDDDDYWYMTG